MCGLTIDRKRHQADVDGRDLYLTLTEFRIIWTLSLHPGVVVSRKQLADSCCEHAGSIQERTIDAHIRAIRHKLKNRADLVETVRGVGYRFTDADSSSEFKRQLLEGRSPRRAGFQARRGGLERPSYGLTVLSNSTSQPSNGVEQTQVNQAAIFQILRSSLRISNF